MRQPQQKNRGRGRGRKQHNPLSRNFESNGPDVKIRGNAGHVAEKYTTLARDALSNGDTVMAENYFQHAEHYNRIVAAAQSQQTANRNEESQNNNANDPQPVVDGVPAEVTLKEDGAAANGDTSEENDAKARRQPRRNRRPESNGAESQEEASASDVSNSDAENAAVEEETASAEGVSEDAAKLPGSIIGDLAVEENS